MTQVGPISDAAAKAAIDRHFAGRGDKDGWKIIQEAVERSEAVRRYYERRQLLAELDPKALDAKARIGAALGLNVPRPAAERGWLPALGVATALGAALVLLALPSSPGDTPGDDGFHARGNGPVTAELAPKVVAYRVAKGPDAGDVPAVDVIPADAELAFAYANPDKHRFLMIWGEDDAGGIYWYHPAWTDPAQNPVAIPIESGAELKELPEAIAHQLQGSRLKLRAAFLDKQLSVRDVEAAIAAKTPLPGTVKELATLKIER